MSDSAKTSPGATAFRGLLAASGLDLSEERAQAAAEVLAAWIPACLELNEKMGAPTRRTLVPITVLAHASAAQ